MVNLFRFSNMRLLLSLLFTVTAFPALWAQDDPEYRMEVGAGIGVMNYLGDYNGNLTSGFQPMGSFVVRYLLNPTSALRLGIGYGKVKGSTDKVTTYYPNFAGNMMSRDTYHFKSQLIGTDLVWEYNFWPYGTGRDYRGAKRLTPYIYAGLGVTYAKCEQQDKSIITGHLPVGIGLKYKMAERLNMTVDYGLRFSMSDELDGRKDPYGIKSSGLFKNTDCYSALQVSLTYSFSAKCRTCNKDD